MQTINLKIEDSFFPHFKAILDSFVKDRKVKIIDYDNNNAFPKNVIIDNLEEVKRRVGEAEKRINSGDYITEDQYEEQMNNFFKDEFGINR